MELSELKEIVGKIRYKKWDFNVFREYESNFVRASCIVRDVDNPLKQISISRAFSFGEYLSKEGVLGGVFDLISSIEQHETNEQFTYDGERIFDPHKISDFGMIKT